MGFAEPGLHARMHYQPVALETGKVRAHSIVGQTQFFGEFIDRSIACTQKLQDASARTFEQSAPPTYMLHSVTIMGIQSKSKEWLTNYYVRLDGDRDRSLE